jgi:prepilin-type N-terminal cleavage/methylation domain-containing protein
VIHRDQKGFTLIELMLVLAIIGVIAAIAIPNFLAYKKKQEELKRNPPPPPYTITERDANTNMRQFINKLYEAEDLKVVVAEGAGREGWLVCTAVFKDGYNGQR